MKLITTLHEWQSIIHKENQLIYVREGKVKIKSSIYNGAMSEGELIVLSSVKESLSVVPITQPFSAYYIRFASASVSRVEGCWNIEETSPAGVNMMRVQTIPIIRHRFEQLHALWNQSSDFDIPTFTEWLELWEMIKGGSVKEEQDIETKIQNIIKHMDLHFEEEFQVEDMARHSGVTPNIFYKRFKESTSLSPLQYVTRNRIEKARQLLVEEDVSIREIANAVGYPDMYYFSRTFKKMVGIPPTRYRQLLRRKIVVLSPPLFEDFLALGVPRNMLIPFWTKEHQKKIYRAQDAFGMELQMLKKEKPELIVGIDEKNELLDQLAEIAPTHLIKYKPFSWREHLRQLADILQVKEIAEYWLYYYEQKTAAFRERIHRQLGNETVLVALVHDEKIRVCGANRRKIGQFLYSDLKLNAPMGTEQFSFADFDNLIELNKFKADHILLLGEQPVGKESFEQILGQVHHSSINPWLHNSAIGHEKSIEEALIHFSPSSDINRNVHLKN